MANENAAARRNAVAVVDELPNCDECARVGIKKQATHDAPAEHGSWGYVCIAHFYRRAPHLQAMAFRLAVVR